MDVILLERIEKLGQMGDVVKVKNGFARNFLLPQKKALRASKDNLAYFEKERVTLEANNLKQKQEAELVLKKLDNYNLVIIRQAGATGGIGKEIARVLIEHNAEVCLSGRNKEELNLQKTLLGEKCHTISCDLNNNEEIINLAKKSEEILGQIDILINNAGITRDNIFLRMSEEEWAEVLNICLL